MKQSLMILYAMGLLPLQIAYSQAAAGDSARVQTTAGPIQGAINSTTITYFGIPYAEAPVGPLRWQPPKPRRAWQEVLDATKFGNHCLQIDPDVSQKNAREDCLFLNVYVPRQRPQCRSCEKLLPVMVWIHGGANHVGTSATYDVTPLVETGGVIVVTMNYRLGPFGFLAHPALRTQDHPTVNYGILDQRLALQWVRANIERFGGDAGNVTIFGESSGGLNVTTHLISPLSAGLFDKAIIQSGGYQLDTPSLAESEALGMAFANRVGCADQTAACLRALSAEDILAHALEYFKPTEDAHAGEQSKPAAPNNQSTVDGLILPESQRVALEAGRFRHVPIMVGSNRDEGKDFSCGAQISSISISKWAPTYVYEFGDPSGALHASELQYLLNLKNYDLMDEEAEFILGPSKLAADSQLLAQVMRVSWAAFARTGNPRSTLLPHWPLASGGIQLLAPSRTDVLSQSEFNAHHECGISIDAATARQPEKK